MTQMDIDFARAARDEGMARAEDKANREVSGWSELALQYIRLFASTRKGVTFTGLELRLASIEYGLIQPTNPKAWGSPLQRASRMGIIKRVGTVPDPNRHCNPVPLWKAA